MRRDGAFLSELDGETNQFIDFNVQAGEFSIIDAPSILKMSTAPNSCLANIDIPSFSVSDSDNCSSVALTTWAILLDGTTFFAAGTFGDDEPNVVSVTVGNHTLEVCAEDACGNAECATINVIVRDEIEPTAACDEELNVSIGGGDIINNIEGLAIVTAIDFDEGSSDACSEVTLEIRRNFFADNTCNDSSDAYSDWGDAVEFYCCDIDREIALELRITDESGNQNICWLNVTPEDKIDPTCFAPANQTLTCADR